MDRLGYDRWGAQGGDWGAGITTALGYMASPGLVGIHLNMAMFQPSDEERAEATPAEQTMLDDAQPLRSAICRLLQAPEHAPAIDRVRSGGLPRWARRLDLCAVPGCVRQRRRSRWSVFTLDRMIDDIMLYWLPNTGASSVRLYWEAMQEMTKGGMPSAPMPTPTGISMFPGEQLRLSRRWAERRFANLVHFNELERGGHFAAMEQPGSFVDEVRATFRSLR